LQLSEKEQEVSSYRSRLTEASGMIEKLERRVVELEAILENATQPGK